MSNQPIMNPKFKGSFDGKYLIPQQFSTGKANKNNKDDSQDEAVSGKSNDSDDYDLYNADNFQGNNSFSKQIVNPNLQNANSSEKTKSKSCQLCGKDFNLLKRKKKNCKFCGKAVCPSCSKKKRQNQKDPYSEKYQRICDECETDYIQRRINEKHYEEVNKLKERKREKENRLEKKIQDIKEKQQIQENLLTEKSRRDKDHAAKIDTLSNDLAKANEEMRRIEAENKKITEQTTILHRDAEKTSDKLDEGKKTLELEQAQLLETKKNIDTMDQEIMNLKTIIINLQRQYEKMKLEAYTKIEVKKPIPKDLIIQNPNDSLYTTAESCPDKLPPIKEDSQNSYEVKSKVIDEPDKEENSINDDDDNTTKIKPRGFRSGRQNVINQQAKGTGSCQVCMIFQEACVFILLSRYA